MPLQHAKIMTDTVLMHKQQWVHSAERLEINTEIPRLILHIAKLGRNKHIPSSLPITTPFKACQMPVTAFDSPKSAQIPSSWSPSSCSAEQALSLILLLTLKKQLASVSLCHRWHDIASSRLTPCRLPQPPRCHRHGFQMTHFLLCWSAGHCHAAGCRQSEGPA